MRRTRHVVLPVRSWQYTGLMIVSLACLTLGLVSRDREGRSGSLAGPELKHTAPHEVDACPNVNPFTRLPPYDETASRKITLCRMSTLSRSDNRNERAKSLDRHAESTWIPSGRRNYARHRKSTNTDRRAGSIDSSRVRDDRSNIRRTDRRARSIDALRVRDDRSTTRHALARFESSQLGEHQHSLSRERSTYGYEGQRPVMSRTDERKSIREATKSRSYENRSARTDAQHRNNRRTNDLSGRLLSEDDTRSDRLVLTSRTDGRNSLHRNRQRWHIRSTIDRSRRSIRMTNLRVTDSTRAEHLPREDVRGAVARSQQARSSRDQRNLETFGRNARHTERSHSSLNQHRTSQRSRMSSINRESSNPERLQIPERTGSGLYRRESEQRGNPERREINRIERFERRNDILATSRRVRLSQSRDLDRVDQNREGMQYDERRSIQKSRINPIERRERRIDILAISRNNQRYQFRERTSRVSDIITRESEERSSLNRYESMAPAVLHRLSESRNIAREGSRRERSYRYRYSNKREHRQERRTVTSVESRYTQRLQPRNDIRIVEEERGSPERANINRVERLDRRVNIVGKSTPANVDRLDVTKVRYTNIDDIRRREARSVERRDERTSRVDSMRRNLPTRRSSRQIVRFDGSESALYSQRKSHGRNFVQSGIHREEARASTRQDRNLREVDRVGDRRKHVATVDVARNYRIKEYPEVRDERRGISLIGVPKIEELVSETQLPFDQLRQAFVLALCAVYGASLANKKGNSYWNILTQTRRLAAW